MNKFLFSSATILLLGLVTFTLVWSDGYFYREWHDEFEHRSSGVALPASPVYQEECGSCHMAYPPGLLPAASWTKLMADLSDHFGDNAELDAETHQVISRFLHEYSADRSDYRRSRQFGRYNNGSVIRITETPYFKHEHDEIHWQMVKGNPKVRSFSQCNACHLHAEKGYFNEHDIVIPNFGHWDD